MSYQKFLELRKSFGCFVYEAFNIKETDLTFEIKFNYTIKGENGDIPIVHTFSLEKNFNKSFCDRLLIENAAFHIGLAETINYWKAVCCPKIIIKPYRLSKDQIAFWEKLFFNGLGEFLYRNEIYQHLQESGFVEFICDENAPNLPESKACTLNGSIIPVGGGKDSIVTLELLKSEFEHNEVFLLDPRKAAIDSAICAGYTREKSLVCHRVFDPILFDMNKKGFLNGHVPYSAILAFCALLTALLKGRKYIILSNEGSANEPTVPDTVVNHQYSKTFEFENDFSSYLHENITMDVEYFSLLRPWSEARITKEFARFTQYHEIFRSCNRGSKENKWCGACPKCLFVFILFASEVGIEYASRVFGSAVLENEDLIPVLDELIGISPVKPFECVGTVSETVYCLGKLVLNYPDIKAAPILLQHFYEVRYELGSPAMVMEDPEAPNLVPEAFKKYVLGE